MSIENKQYNVYQVILAYLFGRYQAYREEGLFQDINFKDFIKVVVTGDLDEKM